MPTTVNATSPSEPLAAERLSSTGHPRPVENAGTLTGREYLRVSRDRSGRARSVVQQHDDNERAAGELGWSLGAPYADPDTSASRYATKARPDFEHLLDDLRGGRFAAEVLILWESSRGSRRVGEWCTLVDVLEDAGVKVWVTTHGRLYDPSNARDRRSLLEDAVDSEYESAKTSMRARRDQAALAAAGKPNGVVPYGYRRIYDPITRKLVRQEEEPAEAKAVRELYRRLDAGHSLRAISRDLDAAGVRGRSGRPMSPQTLRALALNERYKGIRTHVPSTTNVATRTAAVWPPLVDAAVFERVRGRLTAPERKTNRPGRGVHLLSMLVVCDACGGPLTARYREDRAKVRQYTCRDGGHVRVDAGELDGYVTAAILAYLARPDVADKLRNAAADTPELDQARADLAQVGRELDELYLEVSAGRLSPTALAAIEPGILARKADLTDREAELATAPGLAGILGRGSSAASLKRRWRDMPMSAKREVVKVVCSPDLLGQPRITRQTVKGAAQPAHERVAWGREP